MVEAAEFLLHLQKCSGVGDRRINLKSISYDLRIGEQPGDIASEYLAIFRALK